MAPGTQEFQGFLMSDGQFNLINFPGAVETRAQGVNPRGDIVGEYCTAACLGNFRFNRLPLHASHKLGVEPICCYSKELLQDAATTPHISSRTLGRLPCHVPPTA